MSREIRHAERFINQLNPPKPERESKRKRKRPINRDFVDYSLSPKSSAQDFLPEPKIVEYARPPPLKLTLPKPVTYPYERSNFVEQRINFDNTEQNWRSQFSRPEQTTAVHRGGAVLKFKLGYILKSETTSFYVTPFSDLKTSFQPTPTFQRTISDSRIVLNLYMISTMKVIEMKTVLI
jgi:hypothetical protein